VAYGLVALVVAFVGVLMKGFVNLALADIVVILMIPLVLIYKLLGNRPAFLEYAGIVGLVAGISAGWWGVLVVPIQYLYSIWGWSGASVGAILAPVSPVIFLGVAFWKGGAVEYVGKFLAGSCFAATGLLLMRGAVGKSSWSWLASSRPA
jgi:hypothetical protein